MRSAPLVAALLLLGSVPAAADTIRLAQLDRYGLKTVIDAPPGADLLTIRNDWLTVLAPIDPAATAVAVTWATRGLTGSALFDLPGGGYDGLAWGFKLNPWYRPAPLTVTWGAVGSEPQSASWLVQTAVPEPSAIVLVLTGITAMVWTDRRWQRRGR